MHIQINFDDDHPQAQAILALLAGTPGTTYSADPSALATAAKAIADAKANAADDAAREKLQAERDAKTKAPETPEKQPETPKATEPDPTPPVEDKPASTANSGGQAGSETKITLPILQELASSLLQAGERRTFKAILNEHNVKSLSTAGEELYPALFNSLDEAVTNLSL